jgi:hypothetical protein
VLVFSFKRLSCKVTFPTNAQRSGDELQSCFLDANIDLQLIAGFLVLPVISDYRGTTLSLCVRVMIMFTLLTVRRSALRASAKRLHCKLKQIGANLPGTLSP